MHPAPFAQNFRADVIAVNRVEAQLERSQRPILKPDGRYGAVEKAELGEFRQPLYGSDRTNFGDFADQKAHGVEVVNAQVDHQAAGRFEKVQRRRRGVPRHTPKGRQPAEFTHAYRPLRLHIGRVETALETDLTLHPGPPHDVNDRLRLGQRSGHRFFYENVLARPCRLPDQRGVRRGRRDQNNGVDVRVGEDGLERFGVSTERLGESGGVFGYRVADGAELDRRDHLQHPRVRPRHPARPDERRAHLPR